MNGAAPAVFRYDGATPTQIGNTFGTLETNTSQNFMGVNRVIQYQNSLYAVQNEGVYKLQGDGVTWSNATMDGGYPFASPSTTTNSVYRTGLFPIEINGASHLICVYLTAGTAVRAVTMDAATNTWSETADLQAITLSSGKGGFTTSIVYQNKFYWSWKDAQDSIEIRQYDPVLNTISTLTNPSGTAQLENVHDIVVHNGRLLFAHLTNAGTGGRYQLWELVAGAWISLGQVTPLTDSANGFNARETRITLMSDGTNLYYFYPVSTGFKCVEITDIDSLPGTNIEDTVIPVSIRPGAGLADDARIIHVPDTQTNPGSPVHYFYFTQSATPGTSWTLYQWNGNSSVMTAVGTSGGDSAHAIPTASAAGGERIFSAVADDNDILITSRETVSGGIEATFRAYSPSGTVSGTVRIWITTEGEPVMTQATLSSPVTGGSANLSGNLIQNVVADGTTDYTVVIPSGANGFSNLDQVDLIPEFA